MQSRDYKTKAEVLARGQEAIGVPLKLIDKTGRLGVGKGAIGTVLEESWFGYSVNSESTPDFEQAGVELKATPYLMTPKGIRAKERLVCNIIDYMVEYQNTFENSSFYKKCNTMLIMSYEHRDGLLKGEFTVDKAVLFSFPTEDLLIIRQDWEKIIAKIRDGKAHEISEGDTFYLGACTKGATAATVRKQPFSSIMAKQRAYSLKQSYMTYVLQKYIFGTPEDEHIFKNIDQLEKSGFQACIREQIRPFIGMSQETLKSFFQIKSSSKNLNQLLISSIFRVKDAERTAEFQKANVKIKSIRLDFDGKDIKESMSFPAFSFKKIVNEEWEDSKEYQNFVSQKYLFIIFQKDKEYDLNPKNSTHTEKHLHLKNLLFWQLPEEDAEEVERVWKQTVATIRAGVKLKRVSYGSSFRVENNLPKESESTVAHIRPHSVKSAYIINGEQIGDIRDADELPDGQYMTKQCMWFNRGYVARQLENGLSRLNES